jgi:DNA-binding NtrC family response regulator
LVVSPEAGTRDTLGALLQASGHHVHAADDFHHAYQCLCHPEFSFDAVVVTLPICDVSVAAYADAVAYFSPQTSLIFIGSEACADAMRHLHKGDAVAWLQPQFNLSALQNLVQGAIQRSLRARRTKKN